MPIQYSPRTFADLVHVARQFHEDHYPGRDIPIPIGFVLDCKLELNIQPEPGIFLAHNVYGYLRQDLTGIVVDEDIHTAGGAELSCTLAHEWAHLVLHQDIYKQANFTAIERFIQWYFELSDKLRTVLEYEANTLAGLILVPEDLLQRDLQQVCEGHMNGKTYSALTPKEKDQVVKKLSDVFSVTLEFMRSRLEQHLSNGR